MSTIRTIHDILSMVYCRARFNHAQRPGSIFCRCCLRSYDQQAVDALAYIASAKEFIETSEQRETRQWMIDQARANERRTMEAVYGKQE